MIGADEIADALGRPRPTPQQRAVIEAPLEPALVVAGAGSGKTETMANRVLWLLANGHVKPGEITGLTFTRKAAGELAARIRERIAQLSAVGLVAEDLDPFDPPQVGTYNAFANAIYRDNAILLGRESDGAVLGEASAWQLARRIVVASTDERLPLLDRSVDVVTKAVLSLSHELSENVADPEAVQRMAESFAALAELPPGGSGAYADVAALASTLGALPVLVDLAERFRDEKLRRGFVEYSDQVALALTIVRTVPRVAEELRARCRVVLLDEYQDTSVVQTWLLSELFAGQAVMAVGDPNQSIYGWRGASAANLEQFAAQFASGSAREFALTTSWRNGHDVLRVANAIVEPLAAVTRVAVAGLEPSPTASAVPVEVGFHETVLAEADSAARWLKQKMARPAGVLEAPTGAMLFRTRSTQGVFIEALKRHDVPFHVLGIGGLLAQPEIADLVCALSVVSDPTAGSELIRLLAGPRWRIGVRDLRALARVASWLRDRDWAQRPLDEGVRERLRASVAEGEGGSIVDALDFVAHAPDGHTQLATFSDAGRERLREAGLLFAELRARSGLDLLDFVTLVEQELMLDIEALANETAGLGGAAMEAFYDALGDYLSVSENAGLGGFLGWLREAEWRDGLAPRPEDPEPGTVQLLTIHGAKGLEWDHVVVPRLVEGELPGTPREGSGGWLTFGTLPYEFRGDAAELPALAWRGAHTRKEVKDAVAVFKDAVRARHDLEERRLAYVAVTRARHSLLVTGSFWASQTKPRRPSRFLAELAESGIIAPLPEASVDDENPLGDDVEMLRWPLDPLGSRRAAVERAADEVRHAVAGQGGAWQRDVDLLLEERRQRMRPAATVSLPVRVPASRFKDYVHDPAEVAASLRRPMPERPYRATRLGTLFHSWVEQRSGAGAGPDGLLDASEALDAWATERDDGGMLVEQHEAQRLDELKATFERSRWAELKPVEVEREIHLPFADRIVICKIDAVYAENGRYQVVDWKTGKAPTDAADLERRQLQLALYRLAYSRWAGIDSSLIDAYFYFVSDDTVIEPTRVFDEDELLRLWQGAMA
ncbi:ATP-dependent DNA helicase [Microbacterium sp. STN6]|uniref:ATP-dependent DNA helicase n=1 Tax=Microbacterium sp. STN6 TaxID=2995588 RepID=UPI002260E560|nr:ATP-dependent DNA helicase [Microbacterium sp. STN6]MCX7521946.1 ATP-dependent DNA helicase [Microbacterium sp. STN6]